ncbi:COG4702 Uncharacterized conserved protein [Paracoccaceae bacterium]|jgi:uncharacterized protein (UPF0303 family)
MTPDFPSSETLQAEAASLTLPRFAEAEALALGQILTELGRGLTIVINIRTPDRTLFHAALPGSGPINDRWIQRKSATALLFQEASLAVGVRTRAKGESLAKFGLPVEDYAEQGGAVPIRVAGAGVVAVVTVSGLAQVDDHNLAVAGLRQLKAGL